MFIDLPRDYKIAVDFGREFGFEFGVWIRIPAQPKNFFGSHLVIYFANVWNEREADNARERRDFEDDEVKSHIRLSSAQPFNLAVVLFCY